jgi:hypothetical protein
LAMLRQPSKYPSASRNCPDLRESDRGSARKRIM